MRSVTCFLALFLLVAFSLNVYAADEKKIEKKVVVKAADKKAGLGVVVSTNESSEGQAAAAGGAKIIEVFKGSEADAIGLKKGDVIIKLNDKAIAKPSDLLEIMENVEEGEEISLVIIRDGSEKSFKAALKPFSGHGYAFHSDDAENVFFKAFPMPDAENHTKILRIKEGKSMQKKGGYLGVQVKDLSDQLRAYFEVTHGVLVEEVMKDSPAEKAGLKAGDVITFINSRKIEDPEDLVRTINYFNPEEEVEIHFNRKGSKNDVKALLGKKPAFSWMPPGPVKAGDLEWIGEGGENEIIIKQDGDVKTINIKKIGDGDFTEATEEFLIF